MEVIPSIDLRGGQVVSLLQGDYDRETIYDADPPAVAARFIAAGAARLHVVDLEGARTGERSNLPAVRSILAAATAAEVQVGGGVRSFEAAAELFELGAARVIMGTAALEDPALLRRVSRAFPGRVILGLDARDGRVAVHGWRQTADLEAAELLSRFEELPLAAVLHTDIDRDGLLRGPNVTSTADLARSTHIPVLASGGVGSLADLVRLARERVIAGVIVGRALYTGAIQLEEALREVASC